MAGIDDLERWAADARAREAADARVRERWLRSQAEEEADLAGVLLSLAERRAGVVVTTVSGGRHRGELTGVGLDFAALRSPSGTVTVVVLASVADVRVAGSERGPMLAPAAGGAGAGGAELGVRFVDVLAQAAGQRPRISVQSGLAAVVGDLRAVGSDVLTIRTDGAAGVVYVALSSISETSFLASG